MKPAGAKILDELVERYPALVPNRQQIADACDIIVKAYRSGNKLLCCGNGGSASDALHIVGELMKKFVHPRPLPEEFVANLKGSEDGDYICEHLQGALPAVALVGSAAIESAFANDCAPDLSFAQQVLGLGAKGDVLLGISTSGNSKNVIYAMEVAKARGLHVIALTGMGGGKMALHTDVLIDVLETQTFKVQELHLPVYHAICMVVEEEIFS